jgi:hypothetical protein
MCTSSQNQGSKGFRPTGGRSALRRQEGMTTLGLIILVAFVGLFAFAGLRLTPVYLNYMKVQGVLNGVHVEFDGTNPSRSAIRSSISRRFDVESVSEITAMSLFPYNLTKRCWCGDNNRLSIRQDTPRRDVVR